MFYCSLSYVEQAHIIEAFMVELGKCYEQAIKDRELEMLANVDADLCKQVAIGLGLPAPKGNPRPTFSNRRRYHRSSTPGPINGRKIGVIAAPTRISPTSPRWCSPSRLGAIPVVTAPIDGVRKSGRRSVIVERTLLTARSIEYDALVVAWRHGAHPRHQAHCAAAGGLSALQGNLSVGYGTAAVEAAGMTLDAGGVLIGDSVDKSFINASGRGWPASSVGAHSRRHGFRGWARALSQDGGAASSWRLTVT
jgi:catalase